MAIVLPSGFNITNIEPVDARFTVANQSARLGFSSANIYEGLVVYQQDTNELYVLIDTANWNNTSGWQLVGSGISGGISSYIATGSVTASVDVTSNIFLVRSASNSLFSITSTGQTTISGSAADLFIVKGAYNNPIFTVSQSGVVIFATQSVELTTDAPYGGMYFTAASFFVGLD